MSLQKWMSVNETHITFVEMGREIFEDIYFLQAVTILLLSVKIC